MTPLPRSGLDRHVVRYIFRDDETSIKIKFALFRGVGIGGGEENRPKTLFFFRGKRHDNKILKVQILLSRNYFCCHCAGSNLSPSLASLLCFLCKKQKPVQTRSSYRRGSGALSSPFSILFGSSWFNLLPIAKSLLIWRVAQDVTDRSAIDSSQGHML